MQPRRAHSILVLTLSASGSLFVVQRKLVRSSDKQTGNQVLHSVHIVSLVLILNRTMFVSFIYNPDPFNWEAHTFSPETLDVPGHKGNKNHGPGVCVIAGILFYTPRDISQHVITQ